MPPKGKLTRHLASASWYAYGAEKKGRGSLIKLEKKNPKKVAKKHVCEGPTWVVRHLCLPYYWPFSTSGNLRARYHPAAQILRYVGPAEIRGMQDIESCMTQDSTQCPTLVPAGVRAQGTVPKG